MTADAFPLPALKPSRWALGQAHIVIGPTTGICATRPVEQANGGRACRVTPPEDEEAAGRLEVCLEPYWKVHYSDPTLSNDGRMACWAGPPHTPKPSPESGGQAPACPYNVKVR